MRKLVAIAFAGALTFVAACSSDYGRSEAIDDLQESGFSEEEATCVADKMEEEGIDFKEANESEEGSETLSQVSDLAVECLS